MDAQESRNRETVLTKQQRIAEIAGRKPDTSFTSLAHHMNYHWMLEAHDRTRKDGAVGIDGQSGEEYEQNLKGNLSDLLERAKSGRYWAPPVKRVYIAKPGSAEKRPIGIPTFEDKVLQRAIAMLIEPIYEVDFHEFSFGFRPGRSQHQALEYLRSKLVEVRGGWIIDLDIRKFFDTLDHGKLREILAKRVCDGVVRKLIDKWLKAGVMEEDQLRYTEEGTPQGGVISPMLSNIYLHEVLDEWFIRDVQPRMKGKSFMVRYADDSVLGFEREEDARRVLEVLPKRFAKYGLELHPEKTKLLDMRKPKSGQKEHVGGKKPETFFFLGFTHYWGLSRNGYWVVKQKTAGTRLTRAIRNITSWIKKYRHDPVHQQRMVINRKLRGHYAYYGVTGNMRELRKLHRAIQYAWFKWLSRRSRNRNLTRERFLEYLKRYPLAPPRIVHSYT